MTDQQERMVKDVLTTVRSLQKVENNNLIAIVSRITDEIFKASSARFKVMLSNAKNSVGNSCKVKAIKVMREHSPIGLKEAKDIIDQLDNNAPGPIIFLDGLEYDKALQVCEELALYDLVGNIIR